MKKAQVLSIICINAMLFTGTALAQSVDDGCYARQYAPDHLQAHPQQVVQSVLLRISEQGSRFSIAARMADQGHAGSDGFGGLMMHESGMCFDDLCLVDCDGGGFTVSNVNASSIDITTRAMRLVAGEGCGGEGQFSNLAEVFDEPTTYRLYRSPMAVCEGEK